MSAKSKRRAAPASLGKALPKTRIDAQLRRDEVVRLALALVPPKVIAERLNVRSDTVHAILAEPSIVERIKRARSSAFDDSIAILRAGTKRASARLGELIEHEDPSVALRASVELLKLAGADAPKKLNIGVIGAVSDAELEAKALAVLEERRLLTSGEAAAALAIIVDEEPTDGE